LTTEQPSSGDLDFLKDAPTPPAAPKKSRFQLTLQILAVPLSILIVAVGIFVLFSFLTQDTLSLEDLLARTRGSTGQQRNRYAYDFVRKLQQERGNPADPAPENVLKLAPVIEQTLLDLNGQETQSEQDIDTIRVLVHALGNIGRASSAEVVARVIESTKHNSVILDGLQVLGALRAPDSGKVILRQLESPDAEIRKYAAFNLASLNDPGHRPALHRLLKDEMAPVRWNAAFGLAWFMEDDAGREILRSMLEAEADPKVADPEYTRGHTICMAARGLAKIGDRESLERMREISEKDPNLEVRQVVREVVQLMEAPSE